MRPRTLSAKLFPGVASGGDTDTNATIILFPSSHLREKNKVNTALNDPKPQN
jgi:hypothetical protein